jgi:hypothetical protein
MDDKKIVIFGTSSLAEIAVYYFLDEGLETQFFIVDEKFKNKPYKLGIPIMSYEEYKTFSFRRAPIFVSVG